MIKWGKLGDTHYNGEPVEFEFEEGDRVETKYIHFFRWFTRRGTIVKRMVCEKPDGNMSDWTLKADGRWRSNSPLMWPEYDVRLDKDGQIRRFKQDHLSLIV